MYLEDTYFHKIGISLTLEKGNIRRKVSLIKPQMKQSRALYWARQEQSGDEEQEVYPERQVL